MRGILVAASNQMARRLQSDESRLGVTESNRTRLIFTFLLLLLLLLLFLLIISCRADGGISASLKKSFLNRAFQTRHYANNNREQHASLKPRGLNISVFNLFLKGAFTLNQEWANLTGGPQRVDRSSSRWMEFFGEPLHRRKKIYRGMCRKHVALLSVHKEQ